MKMTVVGAGYVGISTALCFAHAGHKTVLLECAAERLTELQAGRCPFYEPLVQEWLSELSGSGMISVTSSPAQAIPFGDIVWIAVNTPAGLEHQLDLCALETVMADIVKFGRSTQPNAALYITTNPPATAWKRCSAAGSHSWLPVLRCKSGSPSPHKRDLLIHCCR